MCTYLMRILAWYNGAVAQVLIFGFGFKLNKPDIDGLKAVLIMNPMIELVAYNYHMEMTMEIASTFCDSKSKTPNDKIGISKFKPHV